MFGNCASSVGVAPRAATRKATRVAGIAHAAGAAGVAGAKHRAVSAATEASVDRGST